MAESKTDVGMVLPHFDWNSIVDYTSVHKKQKEMSDFEYRAYKRWEEKEEEEMARHRRRRGGRN